MTLIKITVSVLIIVFFGLILLRNHGLSQRFQAFDHPVLNQMTTTEIVVKGESSADWVSQWATNDQVHWIQLDVFSTKDSDLFVFPEPMTGKYCEPELVIGRSDSIELKKMKCRRKFLMLGQMLTLFPKQRFWLKIRNNTYGIHHALKSVIERKKASNRIVIQSDYAVVTSALRKLMANNVYSSGRPDETRLLSLHSFFLETVWAPASDIITVAFQRNHHVQVDKRMIDEIHRRKKRFFIDDLGGDNKHILAIKPDGILTSDPYRFIGASK